MKKKFNLLVTTNLFLPFSVLTSCQNTGELIPPIVQNKNLILEKTALFLPKIAVYDDGNQHLIFDANANGKRIYQYNGETINNTNLAINDAEPLSMMKGKNAIELRKNDTLVVDLNFINQYRQNKQNNANNLKIISDFTDVWYKYFTIFDSKATGAGNDSWQAVNQALWTEDLANKNEALNHKLLYKKATDSYFASIKSLQDSMDLKSEFIQDDVFELKLATDKHHLFVTCHYDQTFMHDYFTFAFVNLDNNDNRIKTDNNGSYEKLWESSYIMCNLDKATQDFKNIKVSKTGWTSSIVNEIKKDKWLWYLMGTKSIDTYPEIARYYNCMWYIPAAVYNDTFWYYYAKYTALGIEGFKGYSKQIEPIKIG